MPMEEAASARVFESRPRLEFMPVLVPFGHSGLMLDRRTGSATLGLPLHQIRECPRRTLPRAGEDKNESI